MTDRSKFFKLTRLVSRGLILTNNRFSAVRALAVCAPRGRVSLRCVPGIALCLAGLLTLAIGLAVLAPGRAAAAAKDAVDCADISMSFDAKAGYELQCEEATQLITGFEGSNSYEVQHLEATAADSDAFVDAFHYTLNGRVILTNTDLRNNLQDFYGRLSISDWQSGRAISNLSTAEFKTTMRGLPSHCIAFQKLAHRDWDGYKKIMIGVACSQDDVDHAYTALKYLYLPN